MDRSKIIGFAVGPVATAVFGFFSIPLIAWIFTPEDVGRLKVFQVILSFGLIFSVMGLDQAYVREYHEASNKPALLKACIYPGFFILFLFLIGTMGFSQEISLVLFGLSDSWLYWIALITIFVNYLSRFLSLILRMEEKGLAFSMSQMLPKLLQLIIILIFGFLSFEKYFWHLQLIYFVSLVFVLIIYAWSTRVQWRQAIVGSIDKIQMQRILHFGLPLIFSGVAYWMLTATSTFALRTMSNFDQLAIYSIAASIAGAAAIFQSIFSVIWSPIVYKWVANEVDMSRIDAVAQQILAIVCALTVVCGSLAWLIDLMLPVQYVDVKYIILCCIVQPLLYTLSEVTCMGINITRRTMLSVWVTLAAMIVNITMCIALVPNFGAAGAAIANAIAFLIFFIGRTEASTRVWRKFPRGKLYIFVLFVVALSILTALYASLLPVSFSFFAIILLPIVYICFRNQWFEMYDMIKQKSKFT